MAISGYQSVGASSSGTLPSPGSHIRFNGRMPFPSTYARASCNPRTAGRRSGPIRRSRWGIRTVPPGSREVPGPFYRPTTNLTQCTITIRAATSTSGGECDRDRPLKLATNVASSQHAELDQLPCPPDSCSPPCSAEQLRCCQTTPGCRAPFLPASARSWWPDICSFRVLLRKKRMPLLVHFHGAADVASSPQPKMVAGQ